jgi:hypothetical protein
MTQPRNLGAFADNLNTSGQVSLTTGVSGTLPVGNGGTGSTSTPTTGGVAYGSGGVLATTSAGTSGQVLTSAGSGTPTWSTPSAGAMTLISTLTASSSASLAWTGLSGYDKYLILFENLICSASSLLIQIGTGSTTYITSGYTYNFLYQQTGSSAPSSLIGNSNAFGYLAGSAAGTVYNSGSGASGSVFLLNMTNGRDTMMQFSSNAQTSNVPAWELDSGFNLIYNNSTAKTAVKIYVNGSGNTITSGTASLYGISS